MAKTNNDNEFTGGRLPGTGGDIAGEDVEGHRIRPVYADGDERARDGAEAARRFPTGEDFDVEGHRVRAQDDGAEPLYRNLPTTQGEIVRRGPGDNPHGER